MRRFILILTGLLLGALAAGCHQQTKAAPSTEVSAPADSYGQAPEWAATLPDGSRLSYEEDLRGKVVIVDFWASWCPPCRKEIPGFIELKKRYGDRGLEIVGFSFDSDPQSHRAFLEEQGVNYPSIFALSEEVKPIVAAFEERIGAIEGIPTTLVIDRQGTIVFKHVGYAPRETFEEVLQPLLD